MFGALGWAFGGSMSYMQVIAYTHSGHLPSQFYGFFCLWVLGFLWGGLGGAGTALPAVLEQRRLTQLFIPIGWVFASWFVLSLFFLPAIEQWESDHAHTWNRHESPFYWFDSDWLQALWALMGLALYDLWDRRRLPVPTSLLASLVAVALFIPWFLSWGDMASCYAVGLVLLVMLGVAMTPMPLAALHGAAGALAGWLVQLVLQVTGGSRLVKALLVHPQVDAEKLRQMAEQQGMPYEEALEQAVINWPQFFGDYPQHLGWGIGALLGLVVYFARHGRFSRDASLLVAMACGWFACFLLFPTLLNFGGAGFRMTPPRGDDWAGVLGVFLGAMWWLQRRGCSPVVCAALVSGTVGGLGFAGATLLKLMMVALGNPELATSPAVVEAWEHWQQSNWHSFLEQTYGFFNGIGIALALGWLATRKAALHDEVPHSITKPLAVSFVLFLLLYLNMSKNVPKWVEEKLVEPQMASPWFDSIVLSAESWFTLLFLLIAACGTWLMLRHQRQPIALVPETVLGRAQWFYLVFLWSVVVMNLERALPGFSGPRLLTEGLITANAALVTCLLLLLPSTIAQPPAEGLYNFAPSIRRALTAALVAMLVAGMGATLSVRLVYGDNPAGHATIMKRFGPDATWRTTPILRGKEHL
jgi:hypothetical protein